MTPRRFADNLILGGRQRPIVGSAATVADTLQTWVDQADVDGFMLARTVTPECFEAVADLLVPEIQRRGLYKTAYADGAWRAKLTGDPRMPARHVAAKHR
jgi:alkanesulfonate monooxygenase SsuD/methylene tetrahydromethanopterin reductase-like flavin-dependent oxidoreductase (luciferase family)